MNYENEDVKKYITLNLIPLFLLYFYFIPDLPS